MISKSKYLIDNDTIKNIFNAAGIIDVALIEPLGAGEYNAVYQVTAKGKEYVLKIAPIDESRIMTYEKNLMASEIFWYNQMTEFTDITVPHIYFSDFSKKIITADYFIMDKMPGSQLDKAKLTLEEKHNTYSVLATMAAKIHSIKNYEFGYIQNGLHKDWYQAIAAMVKAAINDAQKKHKRSKRGERLLGYIEKHQTILKKVECAMVNFDIWAPNIICERLPEGIKYGWIDPERSFWGDRIADFVCLEMSKPLEKKTQSLVSYNITAKNPLIVGVPEKIRYAIAQGYLGLIMEVERYFRYTPHHFGWWRNFFASAWLFKSCFNILNNV